MPLVMPHTCAGFTLGKSTPSSPPLPRPLGRAGCSFCLPEPAANRKNSAYAMRALCYEGNRRNQAPALL
jgi:hypothetical protein